MDSTLAGAAKQLLEGPATFCYRMVMTRHRKLFAIWLVTLLAACGGPPHPPLPDDLYRGRSEKLPRLDPSILSGRTIVIDPGHGGYFRGTLGQQGLEEANVNTGVALYLWGLLNDAGAHVRMTRSSERDFLSVTDSSLVGDLAARVALVDSLQPDILVSIHHNAQPGRDPAKNAIETYYRFGDPSSRDLAFAVHRHLVRNLGIDDSEVRPGNYYILRNIDVPAILGEGSYLTHPGVEDHLKLSSSQQLEAEAYFLGILEYFSRGTPRLSVVAPTDSVLTDVPTISFATEDVGGLGIDPASIDLKVNGAPVESYFDVGTGRVSYRVPWDTPNGTYDVTIGVRNVLGNSSRIHTLAFTIEMPPQSATFEATPGVLPPGGGTVRVRGRLLDRRGLSIADGTPVAVRSSVGVVPTTGTVTDGFVEFPLTVGAAAKEAKISVTAGGKDFDVVLRRGTAASRPMTRLWIADSRTRLPIRHASIVEGDSVIANGSTSGAYFLPDAGPGASHWFLASGYQPQFVMATATATYGDTLLMRPWYEGALVGTRFVLDPEGGFGPAAGRGPLGLSGPLVNLLVSRYLSEYLKAAGAAVLLTRESEQTLSARDVVDVTNKFHADRYIEIRHRNAPADSGLVFRASFFPGSQVGSAMAAAVQADAAASLGLPTRPPSEEVTFPLQQTACPAIVVEFPSIGALDEELRLASPWYQRLQAYAVFRGVLDHFGARADGGPTVEIVADSLTGDWLVTLDRTWNLLTAPDGTARFVALGAHRPFLAEARRADRHLVWQLPADIGPVIRLDVRDRR